MNSDFEEAMGNKNRLPADRQCSSNRPRPVVVVVVVVVVAAAAAAAVTFFNKTLIIAKQHYQLNI